jgi:lipid-A-disaccharide synthase
MKYYIIAGEASGDLHGGNLVKELKNLDQQAVIRAWGGDLMKNAGAEVVKHYRDLAFMGFAEVIKNLPTILDNLKFCKKDILQFQPEVLVLIDYPGFNLRIAKWAKQQGLKVVYYISPQVWAWKESRVKAIKETVDKMLVILPFEEAFYKKWNYEVRYVGHPLVQVVNAFLEKHPRQPHEDRPVVALLPGSRKQEIAKKLPIMLSIVKNFPNCRFVVAKASSLDDDFYSQFLKNHAEVSSVKDQTYQLLSEASAALVTSGTATLETALFGVPEVVCYKGSMVSFQIAKRLVKIKYISLVNLIVDKKVVTELIQSELTAENLTNELNSLLHDADRIRQIKKDYADLKHLLQQEHSASATAAQEIIGFLQANV